MKSDLSNVKRGDKIWTIENGWEKVFSTKYTEEYPIETEENCYTLNGKKNILNEFPSAFLEYPFKKEQEIEKDTLVWYRDNETMSWFIGYYSHYENGKHYCFNYSKKSTEITLTTDWKIVTNVNPFL
jgi:hypothetical protein